MCRRQRRKQPNVKRHLCRQDYERLKNDSIWLKLSYASAVLAHENFDKNILIYRFWSAGVCSIFMNLS